MTPQDLMAGPPPTLLPEDEAALAALDSGESPEQVAAAHPTYSLAWALLAETALADARTGYHRSLDLLRRNGWKGHGPVPWSHPANRGFLRSLAALAKAAGAIGETEEEERCRTFLRDSSAEA